MNNSLLVVGYWILCLGFWWILTGKILSNRYAELTGSKNAIDRYERRMIVVLVLFDFITAPLFVPVALLQRGVAGLCKHYANIK